MTKDGKLKLAVAGAAVLFFGLTYDIDSCRDTAEMRSCYRVLGIHIPWTTSHDDGYRLWLRNDIGVEWPQEYVDYPNYHPLFFVSSTPPGNWLELRYAKNRYDDDPVSRSAVEALLKRGATHEPPQAENESDQEILRGEPTRLLPAAKLP